MGRGGLRPTSGMGSPALFLGLRPEATGDRSAGPVKAAQLLRRLPRCCWMLKSLSARLIGLSTPPVSGFPSTGRPTCTAANDTNPASSFSLLGRTACWIAYPVGPEKLWECLPFRSATKRRSRRSWSSTRSSSTPFSPAGLEFVS